MGHRCAPQEKDADGELVKVAADTVAVTVEVTVGGSVISAPELVEDTEVLEEPELLGDPAADTLAAPEEVTVGTSVTRAPVAVTDADVLTDPERLYEPDADADREQGTDAPISHTAEL